MTKFTYNRFGLTENPIGVYIAMQWQGRQLLGEVINTELNATRGMLHLIVRHFNGEMWPVKPVASAVEIIR